MRIAVAERWLVKLNGGWTARAVAGEKDKYVPVALNHRHSNNEYMNFPEQLVLIWK